MIHHHLFSVTELGSVTGTGSSLPHHFAVLKNSFTFIRKQLELSGRSDSMDHDFVKSLKTPFLNETFLHFEFILSQIDKIYICTACVGQETCKKPPKQNKTKKKTPKLPSPRCNYVYTHIHAMCNHIGLNCHLPPLHMPISNSLCACLSHSAFNCETVAGSALLIDFLLLKAQPKGS